MAIRQFEKKGEKVTNWNGTKNGFLISTTKGDYEFKKNADGSFEMLDKPTMNQNEALQQSLKKHSEAAAGSTENNRRTKEQEAGSRTDRDIANAAGFSLFADGENPKSRGGEYKVYRNGTDLIRYDETGYDDRAGGKQYSAMESGPGGRRRFFNSLQEAADWIKNGSPKAEAPGEAAGDAAPLTGDTKIRIKQAK